MLASYLDSLVNLTLGYQTGMHLPKQSRNYIYAHTSLMFVCPIANFTVSNEFVLNIKLILLNLI